MVDASGGDPFINTVGTYNVLVQYSQPVKSETVSISGSSGPTPAQIATAVWDENVAAHTATDSTGELIKRIENKVDDNQALIISR